MLDSKVASLQLDEPISHQNLSRLAMIADREAGIELNADKSDFLISRLSRLMESAGASDCSAFCDMLESPGSEGLVRQFVEAITTHTTSFFRERGHFDWLWAEGFSALWSAGAGKSRDLVVWSAASSTGQELYSAMICAQRAAQELPGFRYRGVGTDISSKVVAQARQGIYFCLLYTSPSPRDS